MNASIAAPAGAPVLLVNPKSFRASRWGRARRAARLARAAGLEVVEASDPAGFRAAFDAMRARRQREVWIFSGDGTIHWLAEYLHGPGDGWMPELLLLGGGRANVVPREGGGYPPMRALRRAIQARRACRPMRRIAVPTLKITQRGQPERLGFLLAGGMIHEGVRVCSEHRARGTGWLHRSFAADFYALLKLLLQVLTGRSPLPPYTSMSVRMDDGRELPESPIRILMATTLGMEDALYNPFAAAGEGAVRATAISANAPHFWRHLPGMLRGRFAAELTPANGVLSGRCRELTLRGLSDYSLDGEHFRADPSLPVHIGSGLVLTVLRP